MKVVIPAAGSGSRFLPLTKVVPKELLLLGELPLIHHALAEAEAAGFEQVLIVVGPNKQSLRDYFEPDHFLEAKLESKGDLASLARLREATAIASRLRIEFVEQPVPLGLGDAVLRCAGRAEDEPLAVLLPDDVIPGADHWHRLLAAQAATGAAALCLRRVPWEETHRYGIAVCESARPDSALRISELVEKPPPGEARSNLCILGRYVATPAVLEALGRTRSGALGELQLTDGFAAVVGGDPGVVGIEFDGEHYDNGTPAEYLSSMARYSSLPMAP